MSFQIRPSAIFFIIALVLVLEGCGGAENEGWTIQEGDLALTETLRLVKDGAFYFGEIYDVAADDEGRIYVADGPAGHVKVLAADGTPQDTIGRPGNGPGEFQRPFRLGLTNEDSLYVMDSRSVSVFSPEGAFAYSFLVQGSTGLPRNMMIPPETPGAFFAYLPLPQAATKATARTVIRHLGSDGEVGDTLFAVRSRQVNPDGQPFPFRRRPFFSLGPEGAIHHAWSGALAVTRYDQNGRKRQTSEIPFASVSVSSEDRENALSDLSNEERAALREHIPDTKPSFERFLVDDNGRYWFGRPTENPDSTDWWVAMPNEKRVVTETLPAEVVILAVTNGHAYGRTTSERGAPALIRYDITLGM